MSIPGNEAFDLSKDPGDQYSTEVFKLKELEKTLGKAPEIAELSDLTQQLSQLEAANDSVIPESPEIKARLQESMANNPKLKQKLESLKSTHLSEVENLAKEIQAELPPEVSKVVEKEAKSFLDRVPTTIKVLAIIALAVALPYGLIKISEFLVPGSMAGVTTWVMKSYAAAKTFMAGAVGDAALETTGHTMAGALGMGG